MSTELAPRPAPLLPLTLQDTLSLADVLVKSGLFGTVPTAQAVVKILYGRELGLGPMASMMGVHIVEGRPTPSATLMATLIQNSGRFHYRVAEWDETRCSLEFYEGGDLLGVASFTIQEAQQARLTDRGKDPSTNNWNRYPKAMLFARAMSQGAKAYCPAVFAGAPVYAADELSEAPTSEGEVVDGTFTVPPAPEPLSAAQKLAIEELFGEVGLRNPVARTAWFRAHGCDVARVGQLTADQAGQVIAALRAELVDGEAIPAPTEDSPAL
jgi:hypothetical protein